MRRMFKVLIGLGVTLLLGLGIGLAVLFLGFPRGGPPPELEVAGTPEQIERGRYLANHVTLCSTCHTPRDFSRYSGPIVTAELGTGGEGLSREDGFPGEVWAPNITPLKLAEWTDGEIARAITSGVSRDGRPLFPFMPYEMYANLSREDVAALVAWVRTLPSRPGRVRPHELDFPLNLIVRLMPKEAVLRPTTPRPGDEDYGEYLTSVSGCQLCHTPEEGHAPVPGMEFAGGYEFPLASGRVVSANITPDQLTGIGVWTRDAFIARFRSYAEAEPATLDSDAPNTVMPWVLFAGMTDEDLGAIYDYLRTVPAVGHRVERWPDADSGL